MTDDLPDATVADAAHRGSAGLTLAAALGFFVLTLDTQVVTVAMPVIGTELNGDITALQWVVSGYTLMLAGLLLSAGSLSDRIGASKAFAIGLAAFTVASVVRLTTRYGPRLPMALGQVVLAAGVCGLLALQQDTPLVVQAAVLLPFGLGAGLAVPALTAALLESVDADRAGLAAGLLNAGRQFGGALGVALFGSLAGGAVVTGLHTGALVAATVLVATTIATVVFVRPRMTAHGQQDEPLVRSGVSGSGARADRPG